jgi:hypothetical protein
VARGLLWAVAAAKTAKFHLAADASVLEAKHFAGIPGPLESWRGRLATLLMAVLASAPQAVSSRDCVVGWAAACR